MANRYLNQFQYTYEKDSVTIYGEVVISTTGSVGSYHGGGVASVSLTGTGAYDIVFSDQFSQLLSFRADQYDNGGATTIAKVQLNEDPATVQADVKADKTLSILCVDYAGSAAAPVSGSAINFVAVFRNSSVGPYDG